MELIYRKRSKSWDLARRLRKFFCLERATIVRVQGASEDKKFAAKPTPPNSNFLSGFGIHVHIPIGASHNLEGDLQIPEKPKGLVLFAHGSGSSRHSPRNRFVAGALNTGGFATLLIDLLTREEELIDQHSGQLRFDIALLTERLCAVAYWIKEHQMISALPLGLFGASTGAAGALCAAAKLGKEVKAVVSRGGRPDLAGEILPHVSAPTLLIVGGNDHPVISMNEEALQQLHCVKKLVIVPHATHLFEESGTLEQVARLALEWFLKYL